MNACCKAALFGAVLLAAGTCRADVTWTATAGGDLDDKANWGGTLPGASDTTLFTTVQTGPLTLSEQTSAQTFLTMKFSAPGTNVFDLGSGKSVLAGNRIFFTGGTTLWLKSGTMGAADGGERVFMGDDQNTGNVSYGGNTLIVDGSDSIFRSAGSSSTTVDGSTFIGLGQNNANNTIVVTNGGTLRGAVKIGKNQIYSTNNVLCITGAGSAYEGVDLYRTFGLGYVGGDNRVTVSDGASFSTSAQVHIGEAALINGNVAWRTGPGNVFRAEGANTRVTLGSYVHVGYAGSSNRMEVVDGAALSLGRTLYVGYGSGGSSGSPSNACYNTFVLGRNATFSFPDSFPSNGWPLCVGYGAGTTGNVARIEGSLSVPTFESLIVGYCGSENELDVNGGTVEIQDRGECSIGYADVAHGNRLRVRDGGVVRRPRNADVAKSFSLIVGRYGKNSELVVDGGSVLLEPTAIDNTTTVVAGANRVASGASIVCTNGASLLAGRIVVGDNAPDCRLRVADSTVTVSNRLDIGFSEITDGGTSSASNCLLRISGAASSVYVQNALCLYNDATFEYVVPQEAVTGPVVSAGSLALRAWGTGPKLRILYPSDVPGNWQIELIRTRSPLPAALLDTLTCACPDTVRIVVKENAIFLRPRRRGLTVIVR